MIPFSPPHIDEHIINEVCNALRSKWITTGKRTKHFEKMLETYTQTEKVLCLNSATAGLELVLRWFGVSKGDEVIIPAYTYCATANVIIHCGAKPVMVDVNAHDFNISVNEIKKAITKKTKVIMPVDIGGLPCDYNEIFELINVTEVKNLFCSKNPIQAQLGRILILADAAHSLGAEYCNKKVGTVADFTVFSFHAAKNLTTAEGGAIAFNMAEPFYNDDLYQYINIMSLHGQTRDALSKQTGS